MAARNVIITTKIGGVYYGSIDKTDAQIAADGSVSVTNCQHVAKWRTNAGGITTLANVGPTHSETRVGNKVAALITGIANVFTTTANADTAFTTHSS